MAATGGTAVSETLYGTAAADVLLLLGGDDSACALAGENRAYGGTGWEWIDRIKDNDRIAGGSGDDTASVGIVVDAAQPSIGQGVAMPLLSLRRCALVLAFGLTACTGAAKNDVVSVPPPTFERVWIDPLPLTFVYAFAPGLDGARPVQTRGAGERPVPIDVGGASRVAIERVLKA